MVIFFIKELKGKKKNTTINEKGDKKLKTIIKEDRKIKKDGMQIIWDSREKSTLNKFWFYFLILHLYVCVCVAEPKIKQKNS